MKRYTQAEARRLDKALRALQQLEHRRRLHWLTDYPGVTLASISASNCQRELGAIVAACKLGHYVVVNVDGDLLRFFAPPKEDSNA